MEPVQPDFGATRPGLYRFGDVVVDSAAHSVSRAGSAHPVEPKAFAVLLELLQRPGVLVGRDELLDRVWGTQYVTPGVLTRVIAQLRRALDDDPQKPRYIQTRHALGYRFIGEMHGEPAARATSPPAVAEEAAPAAMTDQPTGGIGHANSASGPHDGSPDLRQSNFQPRRRWENSRLSVVAGLLILVAAALWIPADRWRIPTHPAEASIAVMPFTSLSGDPNDDYFAQGLEEEMRDALAGVNGLRVAASISPASMSSAAGRDVDAKALGARLGVATILEASVRREASHLRISARLADTTTGFTLWSRTYDRELSGVFETQSAIASEVVHALLGVIPGEDEMLSRRLTPTRNTGAFDSYLQGLQSLRHATGAGDVDTAIARFGQALDADSGFARAQAGLCQSELWRFESAHSADAFARARSACSRAVQMDPTMVEVELAMGDLYRVADDRERALEHYRASQRGPTTRVRAHIGIARIHAAGGQHDLAMGEFQQALKLSDGSAQVHAQIGYQHYLNGDLGAAIASYRKAVELEPDNANTWGTLGALYEEAGDNVNAAQALEHSITIQPDAGALTNLGLLKYQAGDYTAAVALQRRATELDPQDFMPWGNLGDALQMDPSATAVEIRDAFLNAAERAEQYVQLQPNDAPAIAALGYYRIVLGDREAARRLVDRSSALKSQSGVVALLNAETLALMGELGAARNLVAVARAAGMSETSLTSNVTFRRLGLLSPAQPVETSGKSEPSAPMETVGQPPGG